MLYPEAMSAKDTIPSLSSSGMGGKDSSGSAYSPRRTPRPPERPFHTPLSHGWPVETWWVNGVQRWAAGDSPVVDWIYLAGVAAVLVSAACILALG